MAGIYIHIPFCKQACHYCDFHFSTSLAKKEEMIAAIAKEIAMRKNEAAEPVETIYFGGGTPSVLTTGEINSLIESVYKSYDVAPDPEITLEANPDDLSGYRIRELANSDVNRLSIGIQSFYEEDLRLMNRVHTAEDSLISLGEAAKLFDNISIDLIYGIPGMDLERWKHNIETALSFNVPHISSYALTVEPKTALHKLISTGKIASPEDDISRGHFEMLTEMLGKHDFIHYELSNFGKENYFSKNNSAYWLGKKYIGVGPSAHSFSGTTRSWNVANNSLYIKSIASGELPSQTEVLTINDHFNEYIMTGLRTIWGVSLERIAREFGEEVLQKLLKQSRRHVIDGTLEISGNILTATQKGKFLADGIASDLFLVNLDK